MKIEKGTKVFITGAASGIGRSTALALGRRGCRLFLTDKNAAGLEETVSMIQAGEVWKAKALDVSDYEAVKDLAEEIHAEHGAMDIVMNIAGIALFALLEDMEHSHWVKVINTNLWGPIHVIECFVKEMIKAKRGHLVNVSSVAGLAGSPLHAAYSTAKSGLVGLSEVLKYDLRQHHIGVTLICPGGVETPLKQTVEILGADPESEQVKKIKRRFSQHAIPPERVAQQIIDAVEKNKFLVITSFDVKLMFYFKRFLPPLYEYIMLYISRMLNEMISKR